MLKSLKSTAVTQFVNTKVSAMFLRIFAAGFMLYGHGFGKLMKVINGNFAFADPIGIGPEITLILAAFAEGICAFLILIGCWTRFAALALVINMSVAAFVVHAADSFGTKEPALLYLLIFSLVLLLGPGKLSVDGR